MINFEFSTKCYSCGACQAVCPKNAISMTDNGFPLVGTNCVNCGLCEKVCPYLNEADYSTNIGGRGYVCRNKDTEIRKNSSSGGIFNLLAAAAIEQGWHVCGCVYDELFMPYHILTNRYEDVSRMLGSKYVKSNLSEAIIKIKQLLNRGKKVLFSGTPCQIAAIRNLFPIYENILCVGVVCHGSIERDIWRAYLDEEALRGKITSVTMRDKSKGWLNYGLKFTFEDGSVHLTYRKSDGYFLKAFTAGLLERDRCLECAYKGDKILADILLGDAWGMDGLYPELSDEWGLSGVICLTDRGLDMFQRITAKIDFSEVEVNTLIEKNQRIISPAKADPRYKTFRRKFEAQPNRIQELCEKYEKPTILNCFIAKLRSFK